MGLGERQLGPVVQARVSDFLLRRFGRYARVRRHTEGGRAVNIQHRKESK